MTDDDPRRWLGDPLRMHVTGNGSVHIHVPPGERERVLVISLVDAPTMDDPTQLASVFVRVNLDGAHNVRDGLADAIAQIEEHGRGGAKS
jgi:hypothetical protein